MTVDQTPAGGGSSGGGGNTAATVPTVERGRTPLARRTVHLLVPGPVVADWVAVCGAGAGVSGAYTTKHLSEFGDLACDDCVASR